RLGHQLQGLSGNTGRLQVDEQLAQFRVELTAFRREERIEALDQPGTSGPIRPASAVEKNCINAQQVEAVGVAAPVPLQFAKALRGWELSVPRRALGPWLFCGGEMDPDRSLAPGPAERRAPVLRPVRRERVPAKFSGPDAR